MKGKFPRRTTYCDSCDRSWISIGMKCPICGSRQGDGYGKIPKKRNIEFLKEFNTKDFKTE